MFPPRRLLTLSFSLLLIGTTTACSHNPIALTQTSQQQTQTSNNYSIFTELSQSQIIYLGEMHTNPQDHEEQLRILMALHQKNPKVAIAVEMFQRPFQGAVDDYLAGKIDETELLRKTEYEERWGYDWRYYAPLIRYAKEHNLPVIAMNTPTEITRKVAKAGLANLAEAEQVHIPPLEQVITDLDFAPNRGYRQMLGDIFAMHHHHHQDNDSDSNPEANASKTSGKNDRFERFFAAQVLWDETMADSIVQFHQRQPDYQILVIAGQGHIVYDYGIPSRVARRIEAITPPAQTPQAAIKQEPSPHRPLKNGLVENSAQAAEQSSEESFQQTTILFGNPEDVLFADHGDEYDEAEPIADHFWQYDGGLKVKSVSRLLDQPRRDRQI
ncbi:protein of unknown function DUF399 (plasmid) [Thalassoporum mexicanum PCC 7367]|nr:protein of unknown function DUF399 [Pseudanabaena sp. PCC 7367]